MAGRHAPTCDATTAPLTVKRQYLAYADWSGKEYAAVAHSLVTGQISTGSHQAALSAALTQMYAPSTVYLTNYGHHAMALTLNIFKGLRSERDEVIVPAYICPSVIAVVQACGLKAISADVQDDLNMCPMALQAAITPRTLAVIAAHMFGCPARIDEIEAICNRSGIFLIDDAAQVVGVRSGARLLGTFGDVGVISFAQSKTIVTGIRGSGGVLLVNKPALDKVTKLAWQTLPLASGRLGALFDFLWNYQWSARTGHSGYYLGRLLSALGWQTARTDTATQISNLEAGIAQAQLHRLADIVEEKVSISSRYDKGLRSFPSISFPQYKAGCFLARVMLLVPAGLDVKYLRSVLKSRGVETRTGYAAYVSPGASAPKAEAMAQRLIGVPSRAGMSQAEVDIICSELGATISAMSHGQL